MSDVISKESIKESILDQFIDSLEDIEDFMKKKNILKIKIKFGDNIIFELNNDTYLKTENIFYLYDKEKYGLNRLMY